MDVQQYVLNGQHNESYIYDIDSVINYLGDDNYVTAAPLNKEYTLWTKWTGLHKKQINVAEVMSKTPYILFYRKREFIFGDYEHQKDHTAVQYPGLSWYISVPSSMSVLKQSVFKENNITIDNKAITLTCLKSLHQMATNIVTALYILEQFNKMSPPHLSISMVYWLVQKLQKEMDSSNQRYIEINEECDSLQNLSTIQILQKLVPTISPGSMVWQSNEDNELMTCALHRSIIEDTTSSLDILVGNNNNISWTYTSISSSDLDEGYYALARSLAGSKKYLEWLNFKI